MVVQTPLRFMMEGHAKLYESDSRDRRPTLSESVAFKLGNQQVDEITPANDLPLYSQIRQPDDRNASTIIEVFRCGVIEGDCRRRADGLFYLRSGTTVHGTSRWS